MTTPLRIPHFTSRFFPAEAPTGKLLIGLHGRGDSLEGLCWLPDALNFKDLNYLFLNAPDDYGPGDSGYSWYDFPPDQGPGVLRSRALLFDLLADLAKQGWLAKDLVLFGFSQGSLMAVDVGLRYPEALAGIVGISGYVLWPETAATEATPHARLMPWLMTHGTLDQMLDIAPSRLHVAELQAAGIPVVWHEFAKGHTIEPVRELPLIRQWVADALALTDDPAAPFTGPR